MGPSDWVEQLQSGPYKLTERQARNFVAKVKIGGPDECWGWAGSTSRGYGTVTLSPPARVRLAHRIMLATSTGVLPKDDACHSCDNPLCVNPNHLWWGSRLQNMRDASAKRRTAWGTRQGRSILTEEEVLAIRSAHSSGVNFTRLGAEFGTCRTNIRKIVHNETWRHLECRDASSSTSKETDFSIQLPASIASPRSTQIQATA